VSNFLDFLDAHPAEHVALIDDRDKLTYGRLRSLARRGANVIHSRHGGKNFLLVSATADARFITTLLAVIYSGNTPVPIDPNLPEPGREFIKDKCQAAALLDPLDETALTDGVEVDYRDDSIPMMILFTSGTSGFPKGVILSHENVISSCRTMADYLGYHQYPSSAVVLPLHYSYALLSQVCCMLMVGGRVCLFSNFRNPLKFSRTVSELQLETFCGVPSTYHALCLFHSLQALSMPSVRVLCSAGAAMDQSKYDTIKTIFLNAVFFNNYGMTEAAPRIAYLRDDDPRFHEPTCGKPMAGVEVVIVNPTTHQPVPEGEQGILAVRGPNITQGYLHDPEATQAAFTRDGYLLSGDMAYLENGYIYICGRQDDIFNVGGEKVAPLEIERVLNRHPAVELSAVAGIKDEQRGHVPVAFVKFKESATRSQLVRYLLEWLPQSKVPVCFMEVSAFPMTGNGKLQRRQLSLSGSDVLREIT